VSIRQHGWTSDLLAYLQLLETRDACELMRPQEPPLRVDVLIIDEIGSVRPVTRVGET